MSCYENEDPLTFDKWKKVSGYLLLLIILLLLGTVSFFFIVPDHFFTCVSAWIACIL